nr:protein kinase-like domain-containing protein [Tanacetum cinerariifolium]
IVSLPSNEFGHVKIPLEDILSATNNCAQENVLGENKIEKRYKGQLLWSGELIHIHAQRFKKERNDREQLFWTEISMLSTLKHKNVVSLVGFCDENDEKIIIITVDMGAKTGDITRVVLNDDWEPKLCDFDHSMKINASQRHHSFHTNLVKHVNGKSIIDDQDNNRLAPLAITHYREKKLDNIIHKDLWIQIDLHSFNMFVEIAYECLDEERSRRPNIDDIVPRLEKALELARQNRPEEVQKISTSIYVTSFPDHAKAKDLWNVCKQYDQVVDAFIPDRKSKAGKRYGFVRFIRVYDVDRLVSNLCTLWMWSHHLHVNIARFQRPPAVNSGGYTHQNGNYVPKKTEAKSNNGSRTVKMSYVIVVNGDTKSTEACEPALLLDESCL